MKLSLFLCSLLVVLTACADPRHGYDPTYLTIKHVMEKEKQDGNRR